MDASDLFLVRHLISDLRETLMSELSDAIADLKKTVDDALARVQEDVDGLNAKIVELNDKIAQGTATAEDMAAIADLKARVAALDPVKTDTLPEEPAPVEGGEPAPPQA